MNYEIIYNRQFIVVGDRYIPLFQHGNSGQFKLTLNGKKTPVKTWSVFNKDKTNKILFSEREIFELANSYNSYNFYRTRNSSFKEGEFKRWFVNGTNTAKSIEYFTEHGNTLVIVEASSGSEKEHPITSTIELLETLDKVKNKSVIIEDGITQLNLRFNEQNLNLPRQQRNRSEYKEYPFYFVLSSNEGYYIRKLNSKCLCSKDKDRHSVARKFKTEKDAEKYLSRYKIVREKFTIEKVDESVIL
ncbi:hypothetical protein C1N61_26290 (plasmid) [Priestia aryabhattai]